MIYKMYKLKFNSPVHFGNKTSGSTSSTFTADRLFSAFCVESAKSGQVENIGKMVEGIKQGKFLLSDGFPYSKDDLYIPRPLIETGNTKQGMEKLDFIPFSMLEKYKTGRINVSDVLAEQSKLGNYTTSTNCSKDVYMTGMYEYAEESGIYFIVGYEDEDLFYIFDDMLSILGYIGIGGRLTYGCGKFENYGSEDLPKEYLDLLTKESDSYCTLSVSLGKEEELEELLNDSTYNIITRGGYVVSDTYSDSKVRKADVHLFKSGSVFRNKFEGDVFDINRGNGSHPVWKYGKPMFLAI